MVIDKSATSNLIDGTHDWIFTFSEMFGIKHSNLKPPYTSLNKTKRQNVNDLDHVFIEISINLESCQRYWIIMNLWKASEPASTPRRRPTPPPIRTKSANKKTSFRPKRKPKRKQRPTAPAPTDFVGDKPTWEEFRQKGNVCQPTTTAAVPCKKPLKRKSYSFFLADDRRKW